MCMNRILKWLTPAALAAQMNGLSFNVSTWERIAPGRCAPEEKDDEQDDKIEARAAQRDGKHGKGQERDAEGYIREPHEELVDPPPIVTGKQSHRCADQCAADGREDSHQQGDPGAMEELAEDIHPLVRSYRAGLSGWAERDGQRSCLVCKPHQRVRGEPPPAQGGPSG